MRRVRVGITGVLRQWEGGERSGVNAAYVRSVLQAGGIPMIIPSLLDPALADDAIDAFDALLLTGGEDVDPDYYHAVRSPRLGTVSPERDRIELALFEAARRRGLPVLGICRGIQLLNVALGGTLWQDLPSERPGAVIHLPEVERHRRTHAVRLVDESRVARALGTTHAEVNSIHHQAIRDLGAGLVASAWAEDGIVEAVETTDGPWLLGVQWHPEEFVADPDAPDVGLFRALVDAAEAAEVGR